MSEQTPDSMSEHEPSMEDILASIRKIIADDTPAEAGSVAQASVAAMPNALGSLSSEKPASTQSMDADPFDLSALNLSPADDIDDDSTQNLLESIDFDLSEDLSSLDAVVEPEKTFTNDVSDVIISPGNDILELTDPLDDPQVALAGNGSSVDVVPVVQTPDDQGAGFEGFDEDMNLATNEDDALESLLSGEPTSIEDSLEDADDDFAMDDDLMSMFDEIESISESEPASPTNNIDAIETLASVDDISGDDIAGDSPSADAAGLATAAFAGLGASVVSAATLSGGSNYKPQEDHSPSEPESSSASDDDSLDSLLDMDSILDIDSLADDDFDIEAEQVIDPAAGLVDDNDGATADAYALQDISPSGDDDIDLVKSLMAELTDDDFEDAELGDETAALVETETDDLDDVFEAILDDDALAVDQLEDVALPSEAQASGGTVVDAELSAKPGDSDYDDLAAIINEVTAEADAAAEIAQETAEASLETSEPIDFDALELELDDESSNMGSTGFAALAGLAGGAAIAAVAASDGDDDSIAVDALNLDNDVDSDVDALSISTESATLDDNTEISPLDALVQESAQDEILEQETSEPTVNQEEESMPHIVKSETVASDETVQAASGAFASLNKVVEEKAVFSESGPRIGDLVQEALKPMLQDWLDKNLKGIVDRAVAKEIKRISSGK